MQRLVLGTGHKVSSSSLVLILIVFFAAPSAQATPQYEFKLATLAPDNSSLVRIYREMNSELLEETGGRVGFKIFTGFALGDEQDLLRKLRIGLIHAATFTATSLANINPDIRVLQVPFLFNNYQEVDYVLEKMSDELNRGFARRGYQVLGWTELGFIYLMSTIPIDEVADLRGKKVWTTANSPMANAVFVRAQVSPVTISAADVLVALQTKLVEVVYNSPYYALITQWYTRAQYLVDLPLAYIGSGLIISNRAFSRLPAELQAITKRVSAKHLLRVTAKTRQDNEDALNLMFKRGVQKITVEPVQVEQFKELLDQAINDIIPKHLSREYLRKVREALGEFQALQK